MCGSVFKLEYMQDTEDILHIFLCNLDIILFFITAR